MNNKSNETKPNSFQDNADKFKPNIDTINQPKFDNKDLINIEYKSKILKALDPNRFNKYLFDLESLL